MDILFLGDLLTFLQIADLEALDAILGVYSVRLVGTFGRCTVVVLPVEFAASFLAVINRDIAPVEILEAY